MMTSIKIPILALLLASLAIPPQAYAKPPLDTFGLINAAEKKGEISRDEATRHRAWAILDRKRLPERFTDETKPKPVKHGTTLLREIKRNWNDLSPEMREELSPYLFKKKERVGNRTLSKSSGETTTPARGRKVVLDDMHLMPNFHLTDNFNIEWGDDPGTLDLTDDSPSNDIPDIVEAWRVYLETSWAAIIDTQGYTEPLESATYLIDVYIGGTDGSNFPISDNLYGYTDTYLGSGIPFIVVNNDYPSWIFPNEDIDQLSGAMKVTAAHEFFHTVHFTIDYWEDAWWMEASSTWMEDAVFNETNDYYNYIKPGTNWPFYPNVSLLLYNGDHEYGDVIFAKYISEYHGGTPAIKSVWDNCIAIQGSSSINGLSNFFAGYSTSLSDAYQDFAVKNLSMDYAEGSNYGNMKIRSTHNAYPLLQSSPDLPFSDPDYLGSNYIEFKPSGGTDLTLAFDGDEYFNGRPINWGAKIVLFTDASYSSYSSLDVPLDTETENGTLTVTNYSTYSSIYLVASVLSRTGVTPSEYEQTPYSDYPDGVPYAYEVCTDCAAPALPLIEFKDNDTYFAGIGCGGTGCFIATAAFGFYSDPQVMILRQFRDRFLLTNDPGRWFVKTYYRHSPPLAQLIRENGWMKSLTRVLLMPVIVIAWLALDTLRLTFLFTFCVLTSMIIYRRKRLAQ